MSDPAIAVRHVVRRFGDTAVLDDVSFDVAVGEFVTITGPSGAGKSTLLHLLGALDRELLGDDSPRTERDLQELGQRLGCRVVHVGTDQPVAALGSAGDQPRLVEAVHLAVQRGERHAQARGHLSHAVLLVGVQQQPHQQLRLMLRPEHRHQSRTIATHNWKISPTYR